MVESVLLILAIAIGLGVSKALDLAGARGALPTSMQRIHDRNNRFVVDLDRGRERERV